MRVAVITNQFPGPVSTFFARDVRGLLEAGVDVDVFPLYPLDSRLWECVPEILNERVFPRRRVHHVSLGAALASALNPRALRRSASVLRVAASVTADACSYGIMPVAKSLYSLTKASAWAGTFQSTWDHVLAYWGNYSATSAYACHRMTGGQVPFSMLLHAGTDLYREPVLLRQKMLASKNILVVCDFNRRYTGGTQTRIATITSRCTARRSSPSSEKACTHWTISELPISGAETERGCSSSRSGARRFAIWPVSISTRRESIGRATVCPRRT